MPRPGMASASRGAVTAQALGPSAQLSYMVASDVPSIADDGAMSCPVTVVVKDVDGVALAGVTVVLAVSGSNNTIAQPGTSDEDGTAIGSFVSTTAEAKTVSATVGGRPVESGTVAVTVYTAGAIDRTTSTVTVASPSAIAGGAVVIVTLQAKDASGDNLTTGGATVAFANAGGTSVISISATTDVGDGTYTAEITPTTAGTATTLSATIGGAAVTTAMPTFAVTAAEVATAFYDNFETGVRADDVGGYGWGSNANVTVSNDRGYGGSGYSLKFPFSPTVTRCEQRFEFGAYLDEVWFEYQLYAPATYSHRDGPSADNNKFFIIWRDMYGSQNGDFALVYELNRAVLAVATESKFSVKAMTSVNGTIANIPQPIATEVYTVIGASPAPIRIGTWNRIRIYIKTESAAGAADGVTKLWSMPDGEAEVLVFHKANGDFAYPIITGTGANNLFTRTDAHTWSSSPVGKSYSFYNGEVLVLAATVTAYTSTTMSFVGNATGADRVYPTNAGAGHYPATLHNGYLLGAANSGFDTNQPFYLGAFKIITSNPGW